MEIAVVGSEEFVTGFRLAGIRKVQVAADEKALLDLVVKLMDEPEVGILAIHTNDLQKLPPPLRAKMMESVDPVVIPVGEDTGDMRDKIRRAIGIDLYKSK
jgi:V/A-type H+-transporting ATPase subunit F